MKTQLSRLVCEQHTSMRTGRRPHRLGQMHPVQKTYLQRPSSENADYTSDRATWDMENQNIFCVLFLTTSSSAFLVVRRFEGKMPQNGPGHSQQAWAALCEIVYGCLQEVMRAELNKMNHTNKRNPMNQLIMRALFSYTVNFCVVFVCLYLINDPWTSTCVGYQSHLLQRCHPACGDEGSSHVSPVLGLRFFAAMQVQHPYKSSTDGTFTHYTTETRIQILVFTRIELATSAIISRCTWLLTRPLGRGLLRHLACNLRIRVHCQCWH